MDPRAVGRRRDLVVIGASAGGLDAVARVLVQLPRSFPAAICVVIHTKPGRRAEVAEILGRVTTLPVDWAVDRVPLRRGVVHVCPPGVDLVVTSAGELQVLDVVPAFGNRPSIDRLFRSAAEHGSRVVGVLLTGFLHDGVAGLDAIGRSGGVCIVQDPADAAFPTLPYNAIVAGVADHIVPLDAIGSMLAAEVGADDELDSLLLPDTPEPCLHCAVEGVEPALWAAVRAMRERASVLAGLADQSRSMHAFLAADGYERDAAAWRAQADRIRCLLQRVGGERPRRARASRTGDPGSARELHDERGAFATIGLDPHPAPVSGDDLGHDEEAQADAAVGLLLRSSSVERLE
jgi:hypothetical protein